MESDTERVLTLLDNYGVEYKRETDGRAKICCPFHDERTPSMTIYDDNHCYCFGCQKRCWHDELIAKIANCSVIEAKKKLGTYDPNINYEGSEKIKSSLKIPNIEFADPVRDFSEKLKKLSDDIPPHMEKFLTDKGLWDYAVKVGQWKWHAKGTFKCWENQEGICIPYFGPNGEVATFRLRRYDRRREKYGHPLAPRGVPLQASFLMHDRESTVYFCEGETDSLSMHSTGRNVICLPGVGARKQLHSAIMQCLSWNIPKLVFCGDNDEAGQTFNQYAMEVTMTLGLGVFCPQIRALKLPEEYNLLKDGSYKRKDINDFLCEGRLEELLDKFDDKQVGERTTKKEKKFDINMLTSIFGEVTEMTSELQGGLF